MLWKYNSHTKSFENVYICGGTLIVVVVLCPVKVMERGGSRVHGESASERGYTGKVPVTGGREVGDGSVGDETEVIGTKSKQTKT